MTRRLRRLEPLVPAVLHSNTDVDQDVGDPFAFVDSSMPAEEATYNRLPILEDKDHPHFIRKRDMSTRGGEVMAPKATTMEDVQFDTIEATAMKLARGNRDLRLVGPSQRGKCGVATQSLRQM
jgi:nitric oxide reductase NorQ protein